jgi:DNA-3-methyladenine glycosylase I
MAFSEEKPRCFWHGNDSLYMKYHDEEWGVPVYDDRLLFAKLILDGAQAGLSWITILRKRENYWQAFDAFDPEKMARYDEIKIAALMQNAGIVRNRQKINAAIKNAQAYLRLQETGISFNKYLWSFVGGKPIVHAVQSAADYATTSSESEAMARGLKEKGFSFVGATICYAFMQAVGMVNDHLVSCFRYEEINRLTKEGVLSVKLS